MALTRLDRGEVGHPRRALLAGFGVEPCFEDLLGEIVGEASGWKGTTRWRGSRPGHPGLVLDRNTGRRGSPDTLLAAMVIPVPVQQKKTPWSHSPRATASAAASAASAHGVSEPVATDPNATTS